MTTQPDFFRQHPREGIQLLLLGVCLIWQSGIAMGALLFYWLLVQALKLEWWLMLLGGCGVLAASALSNLVFHSHALSLLDFLHQGGTLNYYFWAAMISEGAKAGVDFLLRYEFVYLISLSLLMAGVLALIDHLFTHPHLKAMLALKKKKILTDAVANFKKIEKATAAINESAFDGTVIGVSTTEGRPVVISDAHVNQILLVLGTTGGGKTITMRRFYRRAIMQGYPLIIVDGKPTRENVAWVKNLAEQQGRIFHGFNCEEESHYDALLQGGYTELKDKIITLKDEWSSDYYRSIAEDYLQTTFEVLIKSGKSFDLREAASCLTYENLCVKVRETKNPELMARVASLKQYDQKEITGLQAHLHILLHSELGAYFTRDESTFTLADIIEKNGVVYFALPALKFPSFSKVLGKLVANDLKAVIDRQPKGKKIFTSFDEYSVFAGEQSLNLANMGREKGLHVMFGTQGLADLEKVDKAFMQQITNCANTIICHRLNDHTSAETVAQWVGTQKGFVVTAQINVDQQDGGAGSVREVREFIIHPDSIKQELNVGEAFFITKVNGFNWEKVKIKFT